METYCHKDFDDRSNTKDKQYEERGTQGSSLRRVRDGQGKS